MGSEKACFEIEIHSCLFPYQSDDLILFVCSVSITRTRIWLLQNELYNGSDSGSSFEAGHAQLPKISCAAVKCSCGVRAAQARFRRVLYVSSGQILVLLFVQLRLDHWNTSVQGSTLVRATITKHLFTILHRMLTFITRACVPLHFDGCSGQLTLLDRFRSGSMSRCAAESRERLYQASSLHTGDNRHQVPGHDLRLHFAVVRKAHQVIYFKWLSAISLVVGNCISKSARQNSRSHLCPLPLRLDQGEVAFVALATATVVALLRAFLATSPRFQQGAHTPMIMFRAVVSFLELVATTSLEMSLHHSWGLVWSLIARTAHKSFMPLSDPCTTRTRADM